MSEFEVRYWF